MAINGEQFFEKLEEVLSEEKYRGNAQITARLCLAIGELSYNKFTDVQKKEFNISKEYWSDPCECEEEKRISALRELCARMDASVSTSHEYKYIDRLLLGCLNTNTPISAFAAEYIFEIGENLGISRAAIEDVFMDFIPRLHS